MRIVERAREKEKGDGDLLGCCVSASNFPAAYPEKCLFISSECTAVDDCTPTARQSDPFTFFYSVNLLIIYGNKKI